MFVHAMNSICRRIAVFAFIAISIAFCTASNAEKVAIKLNVSQGSVWTFDRSIDMTLNTKATLNGQTQAFDIKNHQRRDGTLEVLKVENGIPTSVRLKFGNNCETTMEMAGQQQKPPFPFANQEIVISHGPDGKIQTDFKGEIPPMFMQELEQALDPDLSMYPEKEVEVGEEWPGNLKAVAKAFQLTGPNDHAGMTMKLLSVKDINGRRVAEIKVSAAAIKDINGLNMKVISQGVALVDLATGHTLKADLKGTVEQSGTQQGPGPNGQPVTYEISGGGTQNLSMVSEPVGGGTPAPRPNNPNPVDPGFNPLDPGGATFAGKFSDGKLTVDLNDAGNGKYQGTITLGQKQFKATATVKNGTLDGAFESDGQSFPFSASVNGDTMTLKSGTKTYTLKKASVNPLDVSAPPNPLEVNAPALDKPKPDRAVANVDPKAPKGTMRFETYVLKDDPQYIGGEIARALIPAGWKVEGGPKWDMTRTYNPVDFLLRIYNPNGVESLGTYPKLSFFWTTDQMSLQLLPRGQMYMGAEVQPPLDTPFKAITDIIIPRFRRDLRDAKIVKTEQLPKLAEAAVAELGQVAGVQVNARAGKIRFQINQNGVTVEEDVYAIITYRAVPQTRSGFWDVCHVCSIRGPQGKLDELLAVYQVIEATSKPNLQWYNQYVQICQALQNITADAIRQAGIRSQIISQTNKEISATIRDGYQARQATMDRISVARSETMRGVQQYNAGGGQHVELPAYYSHAWQDANGQYILSNDANYDPNRDPNNRSNWSEMQPVR